MSVPLILKCLQRLRLPLSDEKRLQAQIALEFEQFGIKAEREVRLSRGSTVDFMVGSIGVEVKIKGGKRDIYRQLKRYAEHDAIKALVLVTNVPMGVPGMIEGKPVYVVNLARAWM